ncbi:hypothetical protein D9611_009346 [Ephemerocybe angulata]|uniref:Uncharacterized protein n=1 Tax=Ephemerocybe angulata TaxID=980116 RepID=A0A8H5BGS2_9AGAR|nr:hypothetical protein D9611_009346 [Tulosesus angulatus]
MEVYIRPGGWASLAQQSLLFFPRGPSSSSASSSFAASLAYRECSSSTSRLLSRGGLAPPCAARHPQHLAAKPNYVTSMHYAVGTPLSGALCPCSGAGRKLTLRGFTHPQLQGMDAGPVDAQPTLGLTS